MNGNLAFSTRHAFVMLAGVALSALCQSSMPLALSALGSFSIWLFQQRASFQTTGFGAANTITSLRLIGLVALAALVDASLPLWASALAWLIFCLDGLDGFVARRAQTDSSFGALFDAEVDASFNMLLTWSVFQLGHAGAWVLIGGVLRFVYVLSLYFTRVSEIEAPRTTLGRYVFALSVGGYTLSLWPFASAGVLLSGLATALLCYSFSRSFRWTFAPRPGS
ncbi:MAG TPA: CDP-alcohol phosphatidyltransferase family protein [Polyangiales bacterium]|nr:CDP-alcohol phosphatidyltransferase family protein [Polyangiales bacterium]